MIDAGESVSAADYLDAQRLRTIWVREWRELFATHRLDVVATPTVPTEADVPDAVAELHLRSVLPAEPGLQPQRVPDVSVPVGLGDEGHPVGLQLAAGHLEEPRLFAIAVALDEDVRFFEHKPPVLDGVQ